MPLSRCLHFSHELIVSFLLPTATLAHFSCVHFPLLLLSNCPTCCTIHHCRVYSRLGYFFFQLCGMFLSHITPIISPHFDQAIFTVLFTSFSAPPLASNNEPRHLNVFTVFTYFTELDSLVFFWTWHVGAYSVFPLLPLHLSSGNSTSVLLCSQMTWSSAHNNSFPISVCSTSMMSIMRSGRR